MNIRLAATEDIAVLSQMRWDFSYEKQELPFATEAARQAAWRQFDETCQTFLRAALEGGDWYIWVADIDGEIVSHMFVQRIHKVPRPGKTADPYFGYVTNVYTRPSYRGRGIGSRIHAAMEAWAKEQHVEFLIVWPSEDSVHFYGRNGFRLGQESMEKHWE